MHNWVKDAKPMLIEEECLPANDKSCDESNYDDDNNDENDENNTGNYGVFDRGDHEQSDEIPYYSPEMLQKLSAIFLIGLKEKYKLTQTAIQGIIEGFTNVTQQQIGSLQSQVHCYD